MRAMEWYDWLLIAIGIVWIVCAVINYVLLKKMGCDIVIQGEGGHYWVFFAPYWVVLLIGQYRDWGEEAKRQRLYDDLVRYGKSLKEEPRE